MSKLNGGEVEFKFKADDKDLQKKADKIPSIFSNVGKGISKGLKIGTIAIGTVGTALTGLVGKSVQMNGELEQQIGGTEAVFKSFAKTAQVQSKKAFSTMGVSANDYMATLNKMGSLMQGSGIDIKKSMELSSKAMQRAADVASIMGIDMSMAMESIAGAAKGNFTMMDNLGVAMNATTIEAYALSKGIKKSYNEMQNSEKIGLAMQMFLEKTAYATGNYAKENETFAGSLQTLKASFQNFMSGAGDIQAVIDSVVSFGTILAQKIIEMLPQIVRGITTLIQNIIPMIPGMIKTLLPTLLETGKTLFKEVVKGIAQEIPKIKEQLQDIIPYFEAVAVVIGSWKVGVGIQSLIKGFQNAKLALALFSAEAKGVTVSQAILNGTLKASEVIVGLLTGKIKMAQIVTGVLAKGQAVLNAVMTANPIGIIIVAIGALIAGFILLWNKSEKFRNFWIGLWEGIKNVTQNVVNNIVTFFTQTLPNAWTNFINGLQNIGNAIANFFINGWNSIVSFFTTSIPNFINGVINWFKNLPYAIGYQIGQILGNIVQFGINTKNWVTNDLPKIINGVIEWFKKLPGEIWNCLVTAFNKILEWNINVYSATYNWISKTINNIVNWFRQLPGKIWTWLLDTLNKVKNWGINMAEKGKQASINLFNNIVNTINNLPSKITEIGRNIVQGLWNGIINMKNWIVNKVKSFAQGIADGFKNSLGIHSPSKVFFQFGEYVDEGFINGIENLKNQITKAMDNTFSINPQMYETTSTNLSPNINVNVYNDMEQDPLGIMVNKIKTMSGGAKNDYNYGMGVS